MKLDRAGKGWLAVLAVGVGILVGGQAAAQGQEAPLRVMRAASLERPLLVMASDASAPGEAYVDDVLIRVEVEGDFRVYEALHDGITRTLHVPLDAPLQYVGFDTERNQFEPLEPGLRVEMEDYGLLDGAVAAAGGTGGKAYPMLGFAIVHLPLEANPVDAADAIEALPGVTDVRLMPMETIRVPN